MRQAGRVGLADRSPRSLGMLGGAISAPLRGFLPPSVILLSRGSTSDLIAISLPPASITPPISTCSFAIFNSLLPDYETPLQQQLRHASVMHASCSVMRVANSSEMGEAACRRPLRYCSPHEKTVALMPGSTCAPLSKRWSARIATSTTGVTAKWSGSSVQPCSRAAARAGAESRPRPAGPSADEHREDVSGAPPAASHQFARRARRTRWRGAHASWRRRR